MARKGNGEAENAISYRDAGPKAQYATQLMHIALRITTLAADDRQRRILGRYVILHADTVQRWTEAWVTELRNHPITRPVADRARLPLRRLRQSYAKQLSTRNNLVAHRLQTAAGCAMDLRQTIDLWQQITYAGASELCERAASACNALGATADFNPRLAGQDEHFITSALAIARDDPAQVHVDATSYASGEPHLLPITPTGEIGRVVMQINDVQSHLEILYQLRELATELTLAGQLLRTGLIVELATLVELTIGPLSRDGSEPRPSPLLTNLDATRNPRAHEILEQYAHDARDLASRRNLRDMRDKIAAHFDRELTLDEIQTSLRAVDVRQLVICADTLLDWLDLAGSHQQDLSALVVGSRLSKTLTPAATNSIPAALAQPTHDFLDIPFGTFAGGGFGKPTSLVWAAITQRRRTERRQRWTTGTHPGSTDP